MVAYFSKLGYTMQNVNILTLLNICHKYIFSLYFKIPLTKQHAFLSHTCIVRLLVTLPVLYFDRATWGKYICSLIKKLLRVL